MSEKLAAVKADGLTVTIRKAGHADRIPDDRTFRPDFLFKQVFNPLGLKDHMISPPVAALRILKFPCRFPGWIVALRHDPAVPPTDKTVIQIRLVQHAHCSIDVVLLFGPQNGPQMIGKYPGKTKQLVQKRFPADTPVNHMHMRINCITLRFLIHIQKMHVMSSG